MLEDSTINLWSQDGALGGKLIINPMGSCKTTVVEISLRYEGLQNTDYWIGRARHELQSIFRKEFEKYSKGRKAKCKN